MSALRPAKIDTETMQRYPRIGINPGHDKILAELYLVSRRLPMWHKVQQDLTPKNRFVQRRMKSDRDGILKRLRSKVRTQIGRDPNSNQIVVNDTSLTVPPHQRVWME